MCGVICVYCFVCLSIYGVVLVFEFLFCLFDLCVTVYLGCCLLVFVVLLLCICVVCVCEVCCVVVFCDIVCVCSIECGCLWCCVFVVLFRCLHVHVVLCFVCVKCFFVFLCYMCTCGVVYYNTNPISCCFEKKILQLKFVCMPDNISA